MNLKQLETFYWAVKLGSFTAASERLNATQSTVSMRIQDLEHSFGVELFDRTQRSARVTARGRELMRYTEQLLHLAAETRERVSAPDAIPGIIRIGVVEVISITWLPKLVKAVHARYPKVVLELDEALTHDLEQRLHQGSLDLILAPGSVPGHHFVSQPLGVVPFAWMASPEFDLPNTVLEPTDLQDMPVIALSRESHHHMSIEDWFRAGGAHYQRIDTCKSLGVAASLASAGLGVTLLPPRCFQSEIESGSLREIPTTPIMPPVVFTATASVDTLQPLARQIAVLAQEISDFEKPVDLKSAAE